MKLSEKILKLRKKAGLSQEDLANKLDVSRQSVYKWESDLATPEIEKLKIIAKLFNVTFDYLMNDDIVDEVNGVTKKKIVKRAPYVLAESLSVTHADLDHGYIEGRKARLRDADFLFNSNVEKMMETLNNIGATEIIRLQPDATIAYFFNDAEKIFGFYYHGKVQLACPIENFAGFDFNKGDDMILNTRQRMFGLGLGNNGINGIGVGSMPSQNVVTTASADATLYYYDNDNLKELRLPFSVANLYYSHDIKNLDEYNFMKDTLLGHLVENLRNVSARLNAHATQSEHIRNGRIELEEFSTEKINEINSELITEYEEYISEVEKMTVKDNRARLIRRLIGLGVAVGAILAIILIIKNVLF